MNKRMVLVVVLGSLASMGLSPAAAGAGPSMPAYIKFDGLLAGAESDRGHPDFVVVTNVLVDGREMESCSAAQEQRNHAGMITVRIARTKRYLDKASPKLQEKAANGERIEDVVLAIEEGGRRCALNFGKLSRLTVTRRGDFDEVTIRFEEVKVTFG